MPLPPLAHELELDDLYGAPFTANAVRIASANLRNAAEWHIAPVVTETLTVDSDGGRLLFLPTLKLLSVSAVRDVTGDEPRPITGWRFSETGVLTGSWPCGLRAVEVDVTHGYDECPPELLPLLAEACRMQGSDRRVKTQTDGPFSRTFETSSATDPALARYTLPPRP